MRNFILALLLAAAPVSVPAQADTSTADPVVISAGSVSVRRSEFEAALQNLPSQYREYAMGPGKQQFAEDFLRMKLLTAAGLKEGLDRDPQVVTQLALLRENLIANALLQRLTDAIPVPESELRETYARNEREYERVRARHILVAFEGSPAAPQGKPALSEDDAKRKAEALRRRLLQGEAFDTLAEKESDDLGSGAQGGDLGTFGRGQMVPEFEQAAFSTPVGEVPEVIRTEFGYHVIRIEEHGVQSFDEVRAGLEKEIRQQKISEQLSKLVEDAEPTFDPSYFPR